MLAVIIPFVFVLCLFYGFVPVFGIIALGFTVLYLVGTYPTVALCFLGMFLLLLVLSHIPKKVSHGKTL